MNAGETGSHGDMPPLFGRALCLDFVNTVDPRHSGERRDFLADYAALVRWARHAGALSAAEERALLTRAPDAAAAKRAHAAALALREALYDLFAPQDVSAARRREALAVFNRAVASAYAMACVRPDGEGFAWAWREDAAAADRPLWSVVRSAAELLTSDALGRVRECPGESGKCGWLFLDTTKNATRRWCSMGGCGNRAKARRHYARARGRRA